MLKTGEGESMLDRTAKQALSFVVFVVFAALSCRPLLAQMSVTGAVSGTVMDASGAVAPGAVVKLTSERPRVRETKAHETVQFYRRAARLHAEAFEHTGSSYRTHGRVSANEKVALSTLTLEPDRRETVTVAAEAPTSQPKARRIGLCHHRSDVTSPREAARFHAATIAGATTVIRIRPVGNMAPARRRSGAPAPT